MHYLAMIALLLGSGMLSACVTKHNPAKTEIYYPGLGEMQYHCPPGQRKKGRCH